MANFLGLATAVCLVLLFSRYWPGMAITLGSQVALSVVSVFIQLAVWSVCEVKSISRSKLKKNVFGVGLLVLVFATIDVSVGFVFYDARTLFDAFLNAHGLFGWPLTALLAFIAVFVGIPASVRFFFLGERKSNA